MSKTVKGEGGEGKSIIHERSEGYFARRFQLPSNAKADGINAAMENGVLKVTVQLDETGAEKKKITVQ